MGKGFYNAANKLGLADHENWFASTADDLRVILASHPDVKLARFRSHDWAGACMHGLLPSGRLLCRMRGRLYDERVHAESVERGLANREPWALKSVILCPLCVDRAARGDVLAEPPQDPRSISLGQRARIMERDGFRCRRCYHGREHSVPLVVDHIVPVSRNGTAVDSNLQTLCRDCNAGKAARAPHPHDFIE